MSSKIQVSLRRICSTGFFASGQYKEHAHPLMNWKMAKETMLHHYTATIQHVIDISDDLADRLARRDVTSDWEELAFVIKKLLQCTPNEERIISYGQIDELRIVKVSARQVYMLPPLMLPKYNSGNFHIESIDFLDD